MTMIRTQVYLTERQRRELELLSRAQGTSAAALIRDAVDAFLRARRLPNLEETLRQTAGLWSDRQDIGDTEAYVRRLRGEWESRQVPPERELRQPNRRDVPAG